METEIQALLIDIADFFVAFRYADRDEIERIKQETEKLLRKIRQVLDKGRNPMRSKEEKTTTSRWVTDKLVAAYLQDVRQHHEDQKRECERTQTIIRTALPIGEARKTLTK